MMTLLFTVVTFLMAFVCVFSVLIVYTTRLKYSDTAQLYLVGIEVCTAWYFLLLMVSGWFVDYQWLCVIMAIACLTDVFIHDHVLGKLNNDSD